MQNFIGVAIPGISRASSGVLKTEYPPRRFEIEQYPPRHVVRVVTSQSYCAVRVTRMFLPSLRGKPLNLYSLNVIRMQKSSKYLNLHRMVDLRLITSQLETPPIRVQERGAQTTFAVSTLQRCCSGCPRLLSTRCP